ncbi:hypothetical protein [Microbacterium sp.]|uniref:hypothetical protein n=1 Tax=Microbacterium sp. TaxID=51671 RepID=UPI0039E27631
MSEYEPRPRPAREGDGPDLRRLEVARGRFHQYLDNGIARALETQSEIDKPTARCIAHVLGRALGPESLLAEYGRTGEGQYLDLREEYLDLYTDEHITAESKQLIDWFGTFLIQREKLGSGRQFMNEHLPPKLEQVLVRTGITVHGQYITVHIPGCYGDEAIEDLRATLTDLQLPEDEALQAFLALPDVSAMSGDIMESFHESFAGSFHTEEDALRALSPLVEWEGSLADWQIDNAVDPESLEWNYAPLLERLAEVYDLVPWKGALHAFIK